MTSPIHSENGDTYDDEQNREDRPGRVPPRLAEEWDALGLHGARLSHPDAGPWWEAARKLVTTGERDMVTAMSFLLMRSEQRMEEQVRLMQSSLAAIRRKESSAIEDAIDLLGFDPRHDQVRHSHGATSTGNVPSDSKLMAAAIRDELNPLQSSLQDVRAQLSVLEAITRLDVAGLHIWEWERLDEPDILVGLVTELTSPNRDAASLYFQGFVEMVRQSNTTEDIVSKFDIKGKDAKEKLYESIASNIPQEARDRIVDLPVRDKSHNRDITPNAVARALSRMNNPLLDHEWQEEQPASGPKKILRRGIPVEEMIDRMLPLARVLLNLEQNR